MYTLAKVKYKPTNLTGAVITPGLTRKVETTEEWHPSCGKEAVHLSTTATYTGSPSENTWLPNFEIIRYTRTKPRKYRKMSPCVHIRRVSLMPPNRCSLERSVFADPPSEPGDCGKYDSVITHHHEILDIETVSPLITGAYERGPYSWDSWISDDYTEAIQHTLIELNQQALDAMVPRLDTGFSIPQFIGELFEMKLMYEQLASLTPIGGEWPEAVQRAFRKPINEVSNQFLGTIFGLLPFVDDVKTIISKAKTVGEETFRFISEADKRQTLKHRHALSPYTFRDPEWFEPQISNHTTWGWFNALAAEGVEINPQSLPNVEVTQEVQHRIFRATFHATLDFQYTFPAHSAFVTQFLAELDHWGVNLSISDVWELVPFSFVIDWVYNVGKRLEAFDFENLPVEVEIFDYCWSIKYRHETLVRRQAVTEGWTVPSVPEVAQATDVYIRVPDLPKLTPQAQEGLHLPSGFKLVISSALLGSRVRHKPLRWNGLFEGYKPV